MFIGRETEIKFLQNYYERSGSQLLVVYGPKGVGKTALLNRFCEQKECFRYVARSCSSREQRFQWAREVRSQAKTVSIYPSYSELLESLSDASAQEKQILIIDEFHYLIKGEDDFMKELVAFLKDISSKNLLVILCTSASGWVENSMIRRMGILAQSISGLLKVREMKFSEICRAYSGFPKEDYIGIYSILGGYPGFWNSFSTDLSLRDNIVHNVLKKESRLYGELSVMLAEELREPAVYSTILAALAGGCNKLNDIYKHTGFSRAKISVYLKNLMELDLVEKVYSYETDNYADTQKGVYRISNAYVRFYFRFLFPHMSTFQALEPEDFYEQKLREEFPEYLEEAYSKICREIAGEDKDVEASGEWLGKSCSLAVVAKRKDGRTVVANCALTRQMNHEDYEALLLGAKKARLDRPILKLYCEKGFDEEVKREALDGNVELACIF